MTRQTKSIYWSNKSTFWFWPLALVHRKLVLTLEKISFLFVVINIKMISFPFISNTYIDNIVIVILSNHTFKDQMFFMNYCVIISYQSWFLFNIGNMIKRLPIIMSIVLSKWLVNSVAGYCMNPITKIYDKHVNDDYHDNNNGKEVSNHWATFTIKFTTTIKPFFFF